MPLEIRELIIKATVDNGGNNLAGSQAGDGKAGNTALNEVAEKVFEILKEKSER